MSFFTILVVILFLTAIVDLIVGVSNDAVNFLNSAIGSRVASFRTIFIVASFGIILGSTFSSGMMEVARNGIFNPAYFSFQDVIFIFLAVMLTDVILLDIYNSFGLPTSTTVSLVFELLGAAFAGGILTSLSRGVDLGATPFKDILNFSSAITIISGIFLSILFAFVFGTIVQHVSRIIFTFSLKDSIKKYGAIFSGLAVTTIIYFLLIKGAKGSSFISGDQVNWVMANTWSINLVSFVLWSIIIQVLMWWKKINPLKFVVLLGTFALAMAFAGNDLVNFIGVAVGGLIAFQSWSASGVAPEDFNMSILAEKVHTPSWILLTAGIVMIVTLWTNAKSRKVTETEVSLGRQEEGEERFKSNWLSRLLVGGALGIAKTFEAITPKKITKSLAKRYNKSEGSDKEKDKPSFDLLRAAVNLLVSSILIAYATSKKLPLSTTFVTFMVAMGSSFADQAWGRESAVYRVSGVMQVIAGWLATALVAFSCSALVAFTLFKTEVAGVFVLVAVAIFLLIRSHVLFSKKARVESDTDQSFSTNVENFTQAIDDSKKETVKNLKLALKVYSTSVDALAKEKKNNITKALEQINLLRQQSTKIQQKIIKNVKKIPKENLSASRLYILLFDYLQDLYQNLQFISESCVDHLKNFHSQPTKDYLKAANEIEKSLESFIKEVCDAISNPGTKGEEKVVKEKDEVLHKLNKTIDKTIIEIQKGEVGNRISRLQMRILLETKDTVSTIIKIFDLYNDYNNQAK